MSGVTREDIAQAAADRRERIKGYMTQDPPVTVKRMLQMEGMTDRSLRLIIKEIEAEHGIEYQGINLKEPSDEVPYGLTPATMRLRQKLADGLYLLVQRGTEGNKISRHRAAPTIGLNNREQLRAESRPFNHDWKLSQIERLAQALNRDPREFLLSCLTG